MYLQVQAGKMWIEMENVEKGIVHIIAQQHIRWLVMGAATEKHYSKYETYVTIAVLSL